MRIRRTGGTTNIIYVVISKMKVRKARKLIVKNNMNWKYYRICF